MPLESFLKLHHPHLTVDDLEITDSRGNWRVKAGCPGGENCRHAFRGYIGPCDGGTELIVHFAEYGRDAKGRFLRPYREWERMKAQA